MEFINKTINELHHYWNLLECVSLSTYVCSVLWKLLVEALYTLTHLKYVTIAGKTIVKVSSERWRSSLWPGRYNRNLHLLKYVPLLSLRRDSAPKSSPTFSVRPRSSVGRVTVDLIRRSWVRFPPRSKDFFFTLCGSLFPFTRAKAQWVIHGFN